MNQKHYISFLNQEQQKLNAAITKCVMILAGEEYEPKIGALETLYKELCLFEEHLSKDDYPEWLIGLSESTKFAIKTKLKDNVAFQNIINALLNNAYKSFEYVWKYDNEIDFETIYLKYRAESKIEKYFNMLIDQLERIITENTISSDMVQNGIEKIVNVIKQNKGKSLYSDKSLITWVIIFIKNVIINLLKEIPGLKVIIQSIEDTLTNLNSEISIAIEKTSTEIASKTSINVGILYNRSGESIPNYENGEHVKLIG